ncbi:hypothetical protein TI04_12520, partial [Achromatium sp. WMS2]
ASALAFNAWRIAKDHAIKLHNQHFTYQDDKQRLTVIIEYLYFQIHIVDRLTHTMVTPEDRQALISELAAKLGTIVQDNSYDLFGPGNYSHYFIDGLNNRNHEYSEFNLNADGPSYPMSRHLGHQIQQIMGTDATNRWLMDQVMDQDSQEIYRQITKTTHGLIS